MSFNNCFGYEITKQVVSELLWNNQNLLCHDKNNVKDIDNILYYSNRG